MILPINGLVVLLLTAVASLVCGILLYRTVSRLSRRYILRRRFLRGVQGEKDAQAFLARHGYRIIETQARRQLHMVVDGTSVIYEVRVDFIVQRRGKKYVVEVKTGTKAVDPASTDTRRQLLEYAHAYEADGIRLFDADAGALHEVELPIVRGRGSGMLLLAGMLAGAVVAGVIGWVVQVVSG